MTRLDSFADNDEIEREAFERQLRSREIGRRLGFDADREMVGASTHPIPISDPGECWRRRDGIASVRRPAPAP